MKRILTLSATTAAIGLVASVTMADAQVVVGVYTPQTVASWVCEVRREPISDERGWRVRDVIVCFKR
jgi:hypothetical protein